MDESDDGNQANYFPSQALNSDGDAAGFNASIYSAFLQMADEQPMCDGSARFRFFALEPESCVVRLEEQDSVWIAVCKRPHVNDSLTMNLHFESTCVEVSQRRIRRLRALLKASDYWAMPQAEPACRLDGWHGIVEGCDESRYTVVDRSSPGKTPYGKLCNWFLKVKREAFGEQTIWVKMGSKLSLN